MNLRDQLKEFLISKDKEKLLSFLDDTHEIDVVEILDEFSLEELKGFLQLLNFEDIASLVEEADIDLQQRVLRNYPISDIIEIFSYMSPDDIADILGEASTARRKEILKFMKKSDRNELELLLSFGDDTAGGIMTTDYLGFNKNILAKDAIQKIWDIGPKTEVLEEFFIHDINHKLVGTVDIRKLFTAQADSKLEDIMDANPIFIYPTEDQEVAAKLVSKYDLKVIPVVNRHQVILGVITVDDIIDVIYEEHEEDVLEMAGVSGDEDFESSFAQSIKNRLPWLLINLLTALLVSYVISQFSGTIATMIALSATSPIVTGMGGNAGTQTLSITIAEMATDSINPQDVKKMVAKEYKLGTATGFVIGLIAAITVFIRYRDILISLLLLVALTLCLGIANISGVLIPLLMKKMNFNPQLSSGIFLTTITDMSGNIVFLGLATLALKLILPS